MRGDGQNQLKISAPHPIRGTYRLVPVLAALISLDSPFKKRLNTLIHGHMYSCSSHAAGLTGSPTLPDQMALCKLMIILIMLAGLVIPCRGYVQYSHHS
jgi:hypothetical protein